MWAKLNSMVIHLCGSFTDKENACKFCEHFMLWGTCIGRCDVKDDDVHCNETCEKFVKSEDDGEWE